MKLTLKSQAKINKTLEEFDGTKHTDGIEFSSKLTPLAEYEVSEIVTQGSRFAFKLKTGSFVSIQWVSSINGVNPSSSSKLVGNKYITLGKYYLDIDTLACIPSEEITICSECGAVSTHVTPSGEKLCADCFTKRYFKVENYRYRPTLNFLGAQLPKDKEHPVFYGIELEYGFNNKEAMAEVVCNSDGQVFLKSDASIHGGDYHAELVTHPMSFKHIMNNASWIYDLQKIGAVKNPSRNGCHIHISRTAFVDDSHYSLFYFLMHSMYDIVQFVGGREFTDYCKPRKFGKVFTKKKDNKDNNEDRTVMLNELNDNTIEARFFASTDKPEQIKRYVQFLESLIKYTRYQKKVTVSGWYTYCKKYSKKYKELIEHLDGANQDWFLVGEVEYRAPVIKKTKTYEASVSSLVNASKIVCRDGSEYSDLTCVSIYVSGNVYLCYNGGSSSVEIPMGSISEITLEE